MLAYTVHKICNASKSVTESRTESCMDNPEAIGPTNFFKAGGIKMSYVGSRVD